MTQKKIGQYFILFLMISSVLLSLGLFVTGYSTDNFSQEDNEGGDKTARSDRNLALDSGLPSKSEPLDGVDKERRQELEESNFRNLGAKPAPTSSPEWEQDCSVNVTMEWPRQSIFEYPTSVQGHDTAHTVSYSGYPHYLWVDDASRAQITVTDTSPSSLLQTWKYWVLNVPTTGTLNMEGQYDSTTDGSGFYNPAFDFAGLVNNSHIDSEGNIRIQHWDHSRTSGADWSFDASIAVFNFRTIAWDVVDSYAGVKSSGWSGNVLSSDISIDYVDFTPDAKTTHIRSEKKVNGADSVSWKVEIPSPTAQTNFTVPLPDFIDSDYIFVDPSASWTVSSGILEVSDTLPAVYTISSAFKDARRYMANLDDVTADYLNSSNIGFEGAWSDFFAHDELDGTTALNSTVVSSGAYSLRLEDTAGSGDFSIGSANALDDGYYYVAFSYFVESFSGTNFDFYWYDGGWSSQTVDTSSTNLWLQFYQFIHLDSFDATHGNLDLYFNSGNGVIFIDDFAIYQVKPTVLTSAYSEITFAGSLDNWMRPDLLIPVPNTNLQVKLLDRTANSWFMWKNVTTDSNGLWTTTWKGRLTLKELTLEVWSWETYWGTPGSTELGTESTTDWTLTGSGSSSLATSTDAKKGDYSIQVDHENPSWWILRYDPSGSWNLNIDYIFFWAKCNQSLTVNDGNFDLYDTDNDRIIIDQPSLTADTWTRMYLDIDSYSEDTGFDQTITDLLYWNNWDTNNNPVQLFLDDTRIIQAQQYYFSPISAGYLDAEAIDERTGSPSGRTLDFSSETNEGCANAGVAKDGWFAAELTSWNNRHYVSNLHWDFSSLDPTYYNSFTVRLKLTNNVTLIDSTIDVSPRRSDWTTLATTQTVEAYNTYYTLDFPLYATVTSGFTFMLYVSQQSGEVQGSSDNHWVYIDFLAFYHNESLGYGLAYEFEEPGYIDGWDQAVSGGENPTQHNGALNISRSVSDSNYGYSDNIELGRPLLNADYVIMKVRGSSTIASFNLAVYTTYLTYQLAGSYSSAWGWTIYTIDLSAFGDFQAASELTRVGVSADGTGSASWFEIAWMRFYKATTPNLYETSNIFFTSSENDTLLNYIWQDGEAWGEYLDLELIPMNLTTGSHDFSYTVWQDLDDPLRAYLPSVAYYTTYEVSEANLAWEWISIDPYSDSVTGYTSWGNTTLYVYDNGSLLSSGTEGEIYGVGFDLSTSGIHNITVVADGTAQSIVAFGSYSVAAPATTPDLAWEWISIDPYSDSVTGYTSWGNTTLYIYDNGSLVSSGSEGETYGVGFDISTPGLHNLTILANGTAQTIAHVTSYRVAAPATWSIFFHFYDSFGVGLPFETFQLWLNNSRHYNPWLRTVANGTTLAVRVTNAFNDTLYNTTHTITNTTEIAMLIPLYEVSFGNNGSKTAHLEVYKNNFCGLNTTVAPGTLLTVRMTTGTYAYRVYTFRYATQNLANPTAYDYGRRLYFSGSFAVGAQLPPVNVSTPAAEAPSLAEAAKAKAASIDFWLFIGGVLIGSILSGIVWFTIGNLFVKPAIKSTGERAGLETDDWR